jgi:hypothetical protein
MAGTSSTVGAGIAADAITGRATQTARTMYLALLTAAPTVATTMSTMTELTTPATNGYDREICAFDAPDAASPNVSANSSLITFGPFTSDLANVTHCALVSDLTGTAGELTHYWTLDAARDPANGDSITVAAGALTLSVAG